MINNYVNAPSIMKPKKQKSKKNISNKITYIGPIPIHRNGFRGCKITY